VALLDLSFWVVSEPFRDHIPFESVDQCHYHACQLALEIHHDAAFPNLHSREISSAIHLYLAVENMDLPIFFSKKFTKNKQQNLINTG
jgi:hypothetical protein